jgi:hypothetical protein
MNSTEKMLRLNNGKLNTEVQYYPKQTYLDNIAHKEHHNPINRPISQGNVYKLVPKEYNTFNIYRDSDDEISFYYIQKLSLEKETNMTEYHKTVRYILEIMNAYESCPPPWVISVYKWIQISDY